MDIQWLRECKSESAATGGPAPANQARHFPMQKDANN
jgi:hypothetical protein